jgi:hypothetical protein
MWRLQPEADTKVIPWIGKDPACRLRAGGKHYLNAWEIRQRYRQAEEVPAVARSVLLPSGVKELPLGLDVAEAIMIAGEPAA